MVDKWEYTRDRSEIIVTQRQDIQTPSSYILLAGCQSGVSCMGVYSRLTFDPYTWRFWLLHRALL